MSHGDLGCPGRRAGVGGAEDYGTGPGEVGCDGRDQDQCLMGFSWVSWPGAQATEALKITAPDLVKSGVMDEIIREPLGGAHADPMAAFPYIKDAILKIWHTKCAALPPIPLILKPHDRLPIHQGRHPQNLAHQVRRAPP